MERLATASRSDTALRTTSYDWDARGRLTRATPSSGQAVTYSYDALGRRSSRSAGGVTTSFLYDGQDVVLDTATDGSVVDYVNGLNVDEKLKQAGSSGAFYFLNDHLGSVQILTEGAGNTVEHKSYEAFGDSANGSLTRYGYTGREKDDATGLMYYRARWYDAYSGRFASEDPSGFKGGDLNLYAYVGNNPLLYTDPSGLRRCHPLLGALAGGLIGTGVGGLVGGAVGGTGGALALGGAGTLVAPGVGTVVGGIGGGVGGGIGGAGIGAIIGGGVGAGIGYIFCSGAMTRFRMRGLIQKTHAQIRIEKIAV